MENIKYKTIIFLSKKEQSFIAEIPEIAGCMADGETYKSALQNSETVIAEWIETAKMLGREIPRPKGKLKYV